MAIKQENPFNFFAHQVNRNIQRTDRDRQVFIQFVVNFYAHMKKMPSYS